ncbi:helix-turn-helix domain-containing protein [Methylovirgula sp. 4M-Z18]|uniref:helix-turn-helix domain-containing protein n=1 Tax=Methylovirgula sp. 4M-Z18 TaxID=2293567 RepID=UPI001FE0FE09|nr:helix-turn-helix domain-containing protein [Methylovirgula sp. 4M-Z18]
MDERLRFVSRLLGGEAMTEVCREFGISRKTSYNIFDRYKEFGIEEHRGATAFGDGPWECHSPSA